MYKVQIDQFSGPYDLLLQIIEKKDLDITEIALSQVTDQFLTYLESNENINSDELADFLVVAAKLLYLKSKIILPEVVEEDEDSYDLEKHLKMYKSFVDASKKIEDMLTNEKSSFSKLRTPIIVEKKFRPPGEKLDTKTMSVIFISVLNKLKPIIKLPKALIEKSVTIHEKIMQIKNLVKKNKRVGFNYLIKNTQDKVDVIVSFLALLELVNQKSVDIEQNKNFEEIYIQRVK